MSVELTTLLDHANTRWSQLKTDRSSWFSHCQTLSKFILPRNGRFMITDKDQHGAHHYNNIYDSTGTRANRVLAAGMQAGMTSPARPWFRLSTSDPNLDESAGVKKWLADVTMLMQMIFAKSNTYRALHSMYEEQGVFSNAANIVLGNYKTVIHNYTLTAGEYALAVNNEGDVDTLYRECMMSVRNLIAEFGRENCSATVQNMFDNNKKDALVPIVHFIEPRRDRDTKKRDSKNMPWRSVYFEPGSDRSRVLRESGFKLFRAMCPRWAVTGGDVYGHSPGMEALGDIKQLQHQQMRKAQAIDYQTDPPLQIPTSMANRQIDTLPGGVSYVDMAGPGSKIQTAFDVQLDLQALLLDIQDVRERINQTFYSDLFLMISQAVDKTMTATEVAERHEEKLLMLGPVIERQHNESLNQLIDITFSQMLEANIVPPPPQELQGQELNVEFVSMLAQAQRAIATNSIDRFVINLGSIAAIKPEVLDKFDADHWADAYADMLGIDPELVVPSEHVALIRNQRAQQQQAVDQSAMVNQAADTAQKVGSIKTDQPNMLTDVTRQFSGYT